MQAPARADDCNLTTFLRRIASELAGMAGPERLGHRGAMPGDTLTLRFTLPLLEPIEPEDGPILVDIYDPGYYVAYQMAEGDPALLVNPPEPCRAEIRRPEPLVSERAMELAELPADVRELPPELAEITADLMNRITIRR